MSSNTRGAHLGGEHGDVMKLSSSSLFDWNGQEEPSAVFGEHWLLGLQRTEDHLPPPPESQTTYPTTHIEQRLFLSLSFQLRKRRT